MPGRDSARSRSRPQYHYLYGSTDVSTDVPSAPSPSTVGSPGGENDLLLGEGLILTDTEEETPNTSEEDLQQLIVTVTNGNGPLLPPLPPYDDDDEDSLLLGPPIAPPRLRNKPWYARCCDSMPHVTGNHPIGHVTRVVLIMAVAICMCTLVMVLSPNRGGGAMGSASGYKSGPRFDYIPFPIVDREKYNDPASRIVNQDLFDPSLLFKGTVASSTTNRTVDPFLKVPFPTGAFWTNLVVEPSSSKGVSFPIMVYPYAYKWSDTSLQASYPPLYRQVDKISIRDTFNPDLTFDTTEDTTKRHIMAFDSLSVTTRFFLQSGGYWESYLVQGSPYVTIKYSAATPVIRALSTFSDVGCPFNSNGAYKGGSGQDSTAGGHFKWGVCTPYDPSSVSRCDAACRLHSKAHTLGTNPRLQYFCALEW